MIDIGDKVKRLRLKLGLTQEELAARTELSKGFISQLERNLTSPSISTLMDILEALGTDIASFFANDGVNEKVIFSPDDMFVESSSNEDFIQSVSASSSEETEDSTLLETTETSSEQNEIPSDEVIEIPEISNADDTILSDETKEENAEEI